MSFWQPFISVILRPIRLDVQARWEEGSKYMCRKFRPFAATAIEDIILQNQLILGRPFHFRAGGHKGLKRAGQRLDRSNPLLSLHAAPLEAVTNTHLLNGSTYWAGVNGYRSHWKWQKKKCTGQIHPGMAFCSQLMNGSTYRARANGNKSHWDRWTKCTRQIDPGMTFCLQLLNNLTFKPVSMATGHIDRPYSHVASRQPPKADDRVVARLVGDRWMQSIVKSQGR